MISFRREQSILLLYLAGKEGETELVQLYEQATAPEIASEIDELVRRFNQITPHDEKRSLRQPADDIVTQILPVLRTLKVSDNTFIDSKDYSLYEEYLESTLNTAQLEVLRLVGEHLEGMIEGGVQDRGMRLSAMPDLA